MKTDVPLACQCKSVRGILSGMAPNRCSRVICYCKDCQAFARHLGAEDRVLDDGGGSDLMQTVASRLTLTEGVENIGAIRLSEEGLVRWYAKCCNTPLANTVPGNRIPFVGLVALNLAETEAAREAAIGPVAGAHNAAEASDPDKVRGKPIGRFYIMTVIARIMAAKLRGDTASPFFPGGEPLSEPHVLTAEEREAAYRANP